MRQGLFDALAVTETDDSVMAVILACAGKTFVAGADVTEFGKPPKIPTPVWINPPKQTEETHV